MTTPKQLNLSQRREAYRPANAQMPIDDGDLNPERFIQIRLRIWLVCQTRLADDELELESELDSDLGPNQMFVDLACIHSIPATQPQLPLALGALPIGGGCRSLMSRARASQQIGPLICSA